MSTDIKIEADKQVKVMNKCVVHYWIDEGDVFTITPCSIAREMFPYDTKDSGYLYYKVWINGQKVETEAENLTEEEWEFEFTRLWFK